MITIEVEIIGMTEMLNVEGIGIRIMKVEMLQAQTQVVVAPGIRLHYYSSLMMWILLVFLGLLHFHHMVVQAEVSVLIKRTIMEMNIMATTIQSAGLAGGTVGITSMIEVMITVKEMREDQEEKENILVIVTEKETEKGSETEKESVIAAENETEDGRGNEKENATEILTEIVLEKGRERELRGSENENAVAKGTGVKKFLTAQLW